MELQGKKIEFDLEEFVPLLLSNKQEGYREILDIDIMHEESYPTYLGFYDALKERGITKVDLVISDGHKGIKRAVSESFVGSSRQLCSVHFKRNLMKIVSKKSLNKVFDDLNDILKAESTDEAYSLAHRMIATYEKKFPKLAEYLVKNLGDVMPNGWIESMFRGKIWNTVVKLRRNLQKNFDAIIFRVIFFKIIFVNFPVNRICQCY